MSDLTVDFKPDADVKELAGSLKKGWTQLETRLKSHDDELKRVEGVSADTKQELEKQIGDFSKKMEEYTGKVKQLQADAKASQKTFANGRKSIGEIALKAMNGEKGLEYGDVRNKSFAVPEGSFFTKSLAPNLVSDDLSSAEQIVDLTRDPNIYHEPNRQLSMRDIIPSIPISGGQLEIMRERYFGPVDASSGAENISGNAGPQIAQFDDKNQNQLNFEKINYSPYTASGWLPVSRQSLQDVNGLRSYINGRLLYSVNRDVNGQILNGPGTSGQLEGINSVARDYDTTLSDSETQVIDVLRLAMGQLMTDTDALGYYFPDNIVMNHVDWTNIETLKDGEGRYLFGNPAGILSPRIWGVRVVPQNDQPAGEFLIGNFALGSQLRPVIGSAEIRFSDSHEGFFIKNAIAMLAEERIILANHLPNAYITGDFPTGS